MKQEEIDRHVSALREKHGDGRVTRNQVIEYEKEVSRSNVYGNIRKHSTDAGRGYVDLNTYNAQSSSPVTPVRKNDDIQHTTVNGSQKLSIQRADTPDRNDLIPAVNPNYIPWGHYSKTKKILSSGMFMPIYITGDTGNGKTLGVLQACANLKRPAIVFNCNKDMTESDLIGTYVIIDGNVVWQDGPVLVAMRTGSVLVLDEIDQATSRILCLQTIVDGAESYYNKKTNETIIPHDDFMVIGTANTKGQGDSTGRWIGAEEMNEAFLERFPITIEQQYPTPSAERKILDKYTDDKNLRDALIKWANVSRRSFEKDALDSMITTRRLVYILKTDMIFNNIKHSIQYCTNRFDRGVRDALVNLFDKVYAGEPVDDGSDGELDSEDYNESL